MGSRKVAVFFGGPSVEHDVSIISALQLIEALREDHDPIPVYIDRAGHWWTGDSLLEVGNYGDVASAGARKTHLRLGASPQLHIETGARLGSKSEAWSIDVAICAIHGTGGEDGSLLGVMELAGIPYAGGGVGPAASAMNKATAKAIFATAGIKVNRHYLAKRGDSPSDAVAAAQGLGFPCYVKPLSLGSSIGVSRCEDAGELEEALELVYEIDRAALIEPSLEEALEINCAVLGRPGSELIVSETEQPIKNQGDPLGFEDKYLSQGAKDEAGGSAKGGGGTGSTGRVIPALIGEQMNNEVKATARNAHNALGFSGVVRYDFFVSESEVILNEANTVPGSFAFYLFEPVGVSFSALANRLVKIAEAEGSEARATTRTFESVLLDQRSGGRKR